jgi:hypothetical protein
MRYADSGLPAHTAHCHWQGSSRRGLLLAQQQPAPLLGPVAELPKATYAQVTEASYLQIQPGYQLPGPMRPPARSAGGALVAYALPGDADEVPSRVRSRPISIGLDASGPATRPVGVELARPATGRAGAVAAKAGAAPPLAPTPASTGGGWGRVQSIARARTVGARRPVTVERKKP